MIDGRCCRTRLVPRALAVACLALATLPWPGAVARASAEPACDPSPAALAAVVEGLVASDNARDLEGVLAGYTDDVIWLPPSGEPLHGKSSIRPRYQGLFAGFSIDMRCTVLESRSEGGMGFAVGTTEGTLTPSSGGAPAVVDDKFLAVLRCEDGRWRVSHLAWSPQRAQATDDADEP